MSQQANPSAAAGPLGVYSRIPSLAPNRSSANSRLPSPPVSPGLGSPSTPTPAASLIGSFHAPWATLERPGSSGSGKSLSGTHMAIMSTPNSAGVRGYPASGMPRSDSVRASTTILSRTPGSSWGNSGFPAGAQEVGSMPSPAAGGGMTPGPPDAAHGVSSSRSSIQVAVRVRPLCDKEKQRGDRIAWEADRDGNVGLLDAAGAFVPKHRFDTVFGPGTDNSAVAAQVALPLVAPALRGVNGTIFAYGVTSSGKTHTMMGTDADPGVVPRVIRELFAQIATTGVSRCFTVRMSMMEIYNEVLNDLLDPSRVNLKVREDSRSGLVLVESLLEQAVSNAEQALDLIARGDHNRKVSATAFNEDSSRSHTITRIIVESTPPAQPSGNESPAPSGDRPVGRRMTACLSLIDLAGSESARAVVNKGQRMEGSFINRSLLTLGTVIHKLAAGAAGHVPFRDSKLTRLLQPSLSGPGARVAVVCNITPAAAQTDETANTLKFASRAKLIQVTARTNEILDERSLLRRYQKEVADLKRQLVEARRLLSVAGITGSDGAAAPGPATTGGQSGGVGAASSGFAALGMTDEAAAAELQSERDSRRSVEIECTMMRIKLARMQAFLEENGVNVDDVLLAGASADLREVGPGSGRLSSPRLGDDASPLPKGPVTQVSEVVSAPLCGGRPDALTDAGHGCRAGLRHTASTSRLQGDFGARTDGGGPGCAAGVKPRASLSGRSASEIELGAAAAASGPWSRWSSEPHGQPTGRRVQASGESSPSGAEQVAEPAAQIAADLRAQVVAALGAAAGASGGGNCRGSMSGTTSASEVEMDEDLINEGIMAQIRDMITEARLASPTGRQSAISQPLRTHGEDGSTGEAANGGAGRPTTAGRRAGAALAGTASASVGARRTASGCSIGPASVVSSHHRRSATLSTASSSYGAGQELDMDLELQVLNADREVLHDQLVASEAANEGLTAQVADLRRQLGTYEQLTRHAASELAEIRRLKEAFQARLQRENDTLRMQLVQMGVTPVMPPSASGDLPHPPPPRVPKGSILETGSGLAHPPPQSPMQLQSACQQQRYGVQSMAAFGSPAAIAPLSISRATALSGAAAETANGIRLLPDGETPIRASAGSAAAANQQPSGLPVTSQQAAQREDANGVAATAVRGH